MEWQGFCMVHEDALGDSFQLKGRNNKGLCQDGLSSPDDVQAQSTQTPSEDAVMGIQELQVVGYVTLEQAVLPLGSFSNIWTHFGGQNLGWQGLLASSM